MSRIFKNKKRYMIVLFHNKKVINVYHNTMRKSDVMDKWYELKTEKKPLFCRSDTDNRGKPRIYELALIYPMDKRSKPIYTRDELGRNVEVKNISPKHRIRHIIPYWVEEQIYDYETKKHIRFHEFIKIFEPVTEISQIFKLNNKILLQTDDNFRMFGNKNNNDCDRLFDLLRNELINKNCSNFIYIKDVTTVQRRYLYDLLMEKKGYTRSILYRHYSY